MEGDDMLQVLLANLPLDMIYTEIARFNRTRKRLVLFSLNGNIVWKSRRQALDLLNAELAKRHG